MLGLIALAIVIAGVIYFVKKKKDEAARTAALGAVEAEPAVETPADPTPSI